MVQSSAWLWKENKLNYPLVKLANYEAVTAAIVGIHRRIHNIYEDVRKTNWVKNPDWDGWKNDIEGAAAEMAYAKYRRLYWNFSFYGKNQGYLFKSGDVGQAQVRWTDREDGSLIIRTDDDPGNYFVLVIGSIPEFYIVGYIHGTEATKDEYIRAPNKGPASWFVPQHALTKFKYKTE